MDVMDDDGRARQEGGDASHRPGEIGVGVHDMESFLPDMLGQPDDIPRLVIGREVKYPQRLFVAKECVGKLAALSEAPDLGCKPIPVKTVVDGLDDPFQTADLEVFD